MTQLVRTQWDGLASLVAAILLTILSVLDVLPSDQVPTATLGVLALLCFAMIRANVDHDTMATAVETFETAAVESNSQLASSMAALSTEVRLANELYGVPHQAIGPSFIDVLSRTEFWKFKGGTGTYLRAETLPRLALSDTSGIRKVWIEIVNPDNPQAREAYSNYRLDMLRQHSAYDSEYWLPERVRIESYATIVAAIWYISNHNMQIKLALSSMVSSFRYDMSSEFVMITNENRSSTAFRAEAGSKFYARYKDELDLSFKQAQEVDLTASSIGEQFAGSDVRHALCELLGPSLDNDFLTTTTCERIATKAISESHALALGQPQGAARNPYG